MQCRKASPGKAIQLRKYIQWITRRRGRSISPDGRNPRGVSPRYCDTEPYRNAVRKIPSIGRPKVRRRATIFLLLHDLHIVQAHFHSFFSSINWNETHECFPRNRAKAYKARAATAPTST